MQEVCGRTLEEAFCVGKELTDLFPVRALQRYRQDIGKALICINVSEPAPYTRYAGADVSKAYAGRTPDHCDLKDYRDFSYDFHIIVHYSGHDNGNLLELDHEYDQNLRGRSCVYGIS